YAPSDSSTPALLRPAQSIAGSLAVNTSWPQRLNIDMVYSFILAAVTWNTSFIPSPLGVNTLGITNGSVTVISSATESLQPLAVDVIRYTRYCPAALYW